MSGTKHKVFTILLVEDDAGDVDMFLRTVEHELPRHEDEQVTLVINATAEGALERRNHWEKTSHALLVGAILHVLYAGEDKTLRGVANFLSDPASPFDKS